MGQADAIARSGTCMQKEMVAPGRAFYNVRPARLRPALDILFDLAPLSGRILSAERFGSFGAAARIVSCEVAISLLNSNRVWLHRLDGTV